MHGAVPGTPFLSVSIDIESMAPLSAILFDYFRARVIYFDSGKQNINR
jgi:hypothetical protein